MVTVSAGSATAGVTYQWSGPASFTSSTASFTTSIGGLYSVKVTSPNGCSAAASTTVQGGATLPTITASSSQTLTCTVRTSTLTTTVSNVTSPAYLWSTSETTASIVVSNPGIYSVQVTSANDCSAATTVPVLSNAVVLCPMVHIDKL